MLAVVALVMLYDYGGGDDDDDNTRRGLRFPISVTLNPVPMIVVTAAPPCPPRSTTQRVLRSGFILSDTADWARGGIAVERRRSSSGGI